MWFNRWQISNHRSREALVLVALGVKLCRSRTTKESAFLSQARSVGPTTRGLFRREVPLMNSDKSPLWPTMPYNSAKHCLLSRILRIPPWKMVDVKDPKLAYGRIKGIYAWCLCQCQQWPYDLERMILPSLLHIKPLRCLADEGKPPAQSIAYNPPNITQHNPPNCCVAHSVSVSIHHHQSKLTAWSISGNVSSVKIRKIKNNFYTWSTKILDFSLKNLKHVMWLYLLVKYLKASDF